MPKFSTRHFYDARIEQLLSKALNPNFKRETTIIETDKIRNKFPPSCHTLIRGQSLLCSSYRIYFDLNIKK